MPCCGPHPTYCHLRRAAPAQIKEYLETGTLSALSGGDGAGPSGAAAPTNDVALKFL